MTRGGKLQFDLLILKPAGPLVNSKVLKLVTRECKREQKPLIFEIVIRKMLPRVHSSYIRELGDFSEQKRSFFRVMSRLMGFSTFRQGVHLNSMCMLQGQKHLKHFRNCTLWPNGEISFTCAMKEWSCLLKSTWSRDRSA